MKLMLLQTLTFCFFLSCWF